MSNKACKVDIRYVVSCRIIHARSLVGRLRELGVVSWRGCTHAEGEGAVIYAEAAHAAAVLANDVAEELDSSD